MCLPETELVERFCKDVSLAGLLNCRANAHDGPFRKVALLDERSSHGGVEYVRANSGPKSARELYYSLLRPVRPELLTPRFYCQAKIDTDLLVSALPYESAMGGSDRWY